MFSLKETQTHQLITLRPKVTLIVLIGVSIIKTLALANAMHTASTTSQVCVNWQS